MKKCPTCDKTFDDSMKFCQVDGTSLVDDAPAFDPYATMVSTPKSSLMPEESKPEPEPIHETSSSVAIALPNDVLDLPEADPLKTMYASPDEMKAILDDKAEGDVVELPPQPEPPSFSVPEVPAPSFGDLAPAPPPPPSSPPSPFANPETNFAEPAQAPPVFDEPKPSVPFEEAATVLEDQFDKSFKSEAAGTDWSPPPAPVANWQEQPIGANTPFQPPMAGIAQAGQNKTLPIVSLVLGIISLCCYVSPITGIIAVITGFIGMRNANNNPAEYGGKGLAIAGMILGGLLFLASLAYWIFIIFFGGMAMLMDAAR